MYSEKRFISWMRDTVLKYFVLEKIIFNQEGFYLTE